MSEKNKYKYMEPTLQLINKHFVSLNNGEKSQNNVLLHSILAQITQKMCETNPFFKKLYSTVFYGGSFFDGIRVGRPEEFDLDLLLHLPVYTEPTVTISNQHGFVNIQLKNIDNFMKQPEAEVCKKLPTLLDDKKYLINTRVLSWFQGVVDTALGAFKINNDFYINVNDKKYKINKSESGPAVTLKISGNGVNIDIDLVPCFIFSSKQWPNGNYRANPSTKKHDYFIVPKKPNGTPNSENPGRYWRLSFQQQEQELINSKATLKPALRLLKKFRDENGQNCVSSYFIKTIFLWEAAERDNNFWQSPLSYIFITMLEKYCKCLEDKKILYYWNKKFNLLTANEQTLQNFANQTKRILNNINKNPNDPKIIAKSLLKDSELIELKLENIKL